MIRLLILLALPAMVEAQSRCQNCTNAVNAQHATTADTASKLSGTIAGTQVLSCPPTCAGGPPPTATTTTLPPPTASGWTTMPGAVQTTKQIVELAPSNLSAGMRLEGAGQPDVIVLPGGKTLVYGAYSPIPLGASVVAGQHYLTTPPTNRNFVVTQSGITANTQPVGFPIPRYNLQPVLGGQRLLRNMAWNPAFFWTATAACTTGAVPPTGPCWTTPNTGCTMTDGTCTYTAQPLGALGLIADGSALFALGGGDAAHNAPVLQVSRGFNNGITNDHALELYSGDNETETFVIKRGYYWNLPRTNPMQGGEWAVQLGTEGARIAGSQHPFTIVGQSGPVLREETTSDSIGSTPNLPPVVTLRAGGTLTIGQTYCFNQAWQRRETGGLGPAGPYTCVTATTTQRTITLQPRILGTLIGDGLITFYQMLGGFFSQRVTTVDGPDDTITITADDDLGGETRGAVTENQTGNPAFDVISTTQGGWPWRPGQVVPVDLVVIPPDAWATIPPTPFLYQVNAGGCDATCAHCTTFGHLRSVTTGNAPPTWRTDASLFCDAGGTQYQKWDWNGLKLAIAYNPAMDRDAAGSLGIFAFGRGEDLVYRTVAGRPQYVCNLLPQPPCDASTRQLEWSRCGSGTTPDTIERCLRTSTGTFVWKTVFSAG